MNIRRFSFACCLMLFSPMAVIAQSSSGWGKPAGVKTSELFSAGAMEAIVLYFLGAVLLLGCCFLVSTLLSVREMQRASHSSGVPVNRASSPPDRSSGAEVRTAILRRLDSTPALLAANSKGGKPDGRSPSRSGKTPEERG